MSTGTTGTTGHVGWQSEIDELNLKRSLAMRMGGDEGLARQRAQGRLTVRERIDALLDAGTFQELQSTSGEAGYNEQGELTSFGRSSRCLPGSTASPWR